MEVSQSPSTSKTPAKLARSSPAVPKAVAPAMVKKPAVRKKKPVVMQPTPEELAGMIALAAYYLAAERGFSPGHEVDDWLLAEQRVLALLG